MGAKKAISLWDWLMLVGFIPIFVVRWLAKYIDTLQFGPGPALHWRQRLALTFMQAQRATFPTHHLRWLVRRVTTGQAIQRYCKRYGISHHPITLEAGSIASTTATAQLDIPPPTLHLLTPRAKCMSDINDTGPTILYFHGGGFVNPLRGPAHIPFIMKCVAACRAKKAVVVEYALAPEHPYPAQLVQAVTALKYLLHELKLGPDEIVLAGDSAGGQLVGALLAHLVRPSPYAPAVVVHGKFKAALFVSPFVRLAGADVGSYESNGKRDFLNRVQVDEFMDAWKPKEDEIWANMCGVDSADEVWDRVFGRALDNDGLVSKVMVTVGTAEIFLDCCRLFANKHVQAETVTATRDTDRHAFEGRDVVFAVCEGEAHVQVALDSVVRFDKGAKMRSIMSWLATL